MKLLNNTGIILIVLVMNLISCVKKENDLVKQYYGKVNVDLARFPGTPELELRFNGEKISDLPIPDRSAVRIDAGVSGKLGVYIKGTDTLVADSSIHLKRDELKTFKVAYSRDLGIQGWLNSKPVSPDSLSVQMLNNLGDAYKGYKSLDLCFFLYDFNTGELVPIDAVIHDFGKVRLSSQVISLWFANPVTGDPNYFLCRLKNNETGEYIVQPSGSDFVVLLQEYGGANYIFSINGDAGGDLSVSTIYL